MNTKDLAKSAIIATLYVALTFVSAFFGLASGAVQIRISEALTVLPLFTTAAIPGLTIGCMLSNILTGCALWDIVFGTLATFLGAIGTRLLKKNKYLSVIPPVFFNTLIIPFVLRLVYGVDEMLPYLFFTVGIGEIISCGILGIILIKYLEKHNKIF